MLSNLEMVLIYDNRIQVSNFSNLNFPSCGSNWHIWQAQQLCHFFTMKFYYLILRSFSMPRAFCGRQGSACLKRKLSHRIWMKTWFFQQHEKASKNHCKVMQEETTHAFHLFLTVQERRQGIGWWQCITTLYHNDWRWLDIMCVVGGFNIDDNMHFLCLENWHDLYHAIFMLHFVQYYAVCLRLDSAIRSKIWQSAMQLSQNPNEFS